MSDLQFEDEWWLDQEPYPGPVQQHSLWEVMKEFRALQKAVGLTMDQFNGRVKEIWSAYKEAISNTFPYIPRTRKDQTYDPDFDNSLLFDPSWGEKERRKHALLCQQNRNTGPRTEWGFHRDGRRTT